MAKNIWLCHNCNSDNVYSPLNLKGVNKCFDCGQEVEVTECPLPDGVKVIGFQVVDKNGVNHPEIEECNHVYSLSQSRKLLSKCTEQWQLMTVWSCDIEPVELMYKGRNPRK